MTTIRLKPVSVSKLGGTWYAPKMTVHYWPWNRAHRWHAQYIDRLGFQRDIYADTRTQLQAMLGARLELPRNREVH